MSIVTNIFASQINASLRKTMAEDVDLIKLKELGTETLMGIYNTLVNSAIEMRITELLETGDEESLELIEKIKVNPRCDAQLRRELNFAARGMACGVYKSKNWIA